MAKKVYSSAYKEKIVKLASEGVPILQLEREYEPTASTIHAWIKASKQNQKAVEVERKTAAELRRLRRENQRLKEINQILEKAKVWSVRHHRPKPSE